VDWKGRCGLRGRDFGQPLNEFILLDFNRKSSGHLESVSSLFVGVVAKFYYQPSFEISKTKFHLVLPDALKVRNQIVIPDFK
jgi:hypothetical protein